MIGWNTCLGSRVSGLGLLVATGDKWLYGKTGRRNKKVMEGHLLSLSCFQKFVN